MPNLSLLGHLSGILTGTLQSGRGGRALQAMFAPSFETLARIEQSVLCQRILPLLTRYGYVPVPASAPALYSVISRSSGGGGGCGSTAISAVQIGAGRMGTRCAQGCQAASRAIVGRDDPHDNDHEGSAGTTSVRRLGDEWRRLLARLAHALVHRTRSARRSPEDASLDDEHEQLLLVETTTTSRTAARHRRSEQDGLEAGEGDDEEDDDASEERDVAFV